MTEVQKRLNPEKEAERIISRYNPDKLSPFPYGNIQKDRNDLSIFLVSLPNDISGLIQYNKDNSGFTIFINNEKPKTRQHFTVAHELGHYFLHQEYLKSEKVFIDGEGSLDGNRTLFRLDTAVYNKIETEANSFAASLIMPAELVKDAWISLKDVQACAKIFDVSVSAMSIRLERLNLITYR